MMIHKNIKKGGLKMTDTMVLPASEFELPDEAKISEIFERLMRVNAAVTENGLHEMYTERHDRYEEGYAIGF